MGRGKGGVRSIDAAGLLGTHEEADDVWVLQARVRVDLGDDAIDHVAPVLSAEVLRDDLDGHLGAAASEEE